MFLSDDQATLQQGEARTRVHCAAMCRLLVSLGHTMSLEKCELGPTRELRFLGLMVDLELRTFAVPIDKAERLRDLVAELKEEECISDRWPEWQERSWPWRRP